MSTAALVIPNRDGEAYLPRCLDAVGRLSPAPDEMLVVDDASTDGSVELLQQSYPWVRLIPSGPEGKPHGFAGAVNTGIRACRSDYVALLNNDTEVDPGWLGALVSALDAAPHAASCASRMYQADGTTINAVGLKLTRDGTCQALGDGQADDGAFSRPCAIFGPSGGAALWRRTALEAIGLFDEDFFAYYEDADLAFRARAAGWTALYAPDSRVIHTEGRCPSLARREKVCLRLRNAVWFVWTNLPGPMLRRHGLRLLWATGLRYALKYGLRPWKVEGRAFWQAFGQVVCQPGALLRKRRSRQAGHTVPPEALSVWMGRDPFVE